MYLFNGLSYKNNTFLVEVINKYKSLLLTNRN